MLDMIEPKRVFADIMKGKVSENGPVRSVEWTVPRDLPYFNGHFPQSPIFPAVGITDASFVLLQKALEKPDLKLKAVPLAKFVSLITPEQKVRIEWQALAEHEWQFEWKEAGTDRLLATLRLFA